MIRDPLRREFRLSLQAYPRPCPVERGDEVGIRVLQRVEEDAVGIEPADHLREFVDVLTAAPGSRVPWVVVDEHAYAGIVQGSRGFRQAGDVIEIPLVALVDADDGIRVPQHDAVESAEPLVRIVEEALRGEPLPLRVEEQLVP